MNKISVEISTPRFLRGRHWDAASKNTALYTALRSAILHGPPYPTAPSMPISNIKTKLLTRKLYQMDEIQYVLNAMATFHSREIMNLWTDFHASNYRKGLNLNKGCPSAKTHKSGSSAQGHLGSRKSSSALKTCHHVHFLNCKEKVYQKAQLLNFTTRAKGAAESNNKNGFCRSCGNGLGANH